MKNIICFFAFTLVLLFVSTTNAQTKIPHTNDKGYAMINYKKTAPDTYEQAMLNEINLVRKNPKGYIPFVKNYIVKKKLKGEALTYANELIAQLDTLSARKVLEFAPCMYETAKKHAINQSPTGQINHNDTNGKDPAKRLGETCPDKFSEWIPFPPGSGQQIKNGRENLAWDVNYSGYGLDARRSNIQLLIDAGVPSRGHRYTILTDAWTHCAAFTYEDYTADGTKYDRWIQMFGIQYIASSGTANGSSSSTTVLTTIPPGCPTTQGSSIGWPNTIDGKTVSKECFDYWWKNWKQ